MTKNQRLIYKEVPHDVPIPGQTLKLETEEIDVDTVPLNGGVLVQNWALSLDPYMRGRMRDPKVWSYAPAYAQGEPMLGFGVGTIVRSEHEGYKVDQALYGYTTFENYSVVSAEKLATSRFRILENKEKLPWTVLVGAVGMPGQTAWQGFTELAGAKKGETIFVSAAAGAVGQLVGQLAKRAGLKVIGSAGSDDKVAFIKELGFDITFNYKKQSTEEILKQHPIDIYWDNVGGETLDLAIDAMNVHGRIVACGSVSQYNLPAEEKYRLKNWPLIVGKQIRYQGFIVNAGPKFFEEMPHLVASGDIKIREHVTHGFDNGEAFVDMLTGKAEGKAVISLE